MSQWNSHEAFLLQEGSHIRCLWGIKLRIGCQELLCMKLSLIAQLAELGLSHLSLQCEQHVVNVKNLLQGQSTAHEISEDMSSTCLPCNFKPKTISW